MATSILLRDEAIPERLVVLRLGVNTLGDEALVRTCSDAYDEWGIHAFSVLELPADDWDELARVMPIVRKRPKVMEASGPGLLRDGFPLLPTRGRLHWSVVLSEPTPEQFARVRTHFRGPIDNPAWEGRRD
jgi:hypothetical protein